ncbi:MAG: hypothetical protein K2N88_02575 [Muribaculaceae bacterium]|nr:hypothetical protein [Muribaculaceae bacterium]
MTINNKVTTFNGYEYNDCGVCVNPDKPYRFGNDHNFYFEIEVSESSQGWAYGYHWSCGTSGGGSPCMPNRACASRSKAVIACAEQLKQNFKGSKAKPFIAELDRIIAEESGKKNPQPKQYSIFDYL